MLITIVSHLIVIPNSIVFIITPRKFWNMHFIDIETSLSDIQI